MKLIRISLFILLLLLISCSQQKTPEDKQNGTANQDVTSAETADAENATADEIIMGPKDEDHDYYIGLSYSGEQPGDGIARYYVIITCTDNAKSVETLKFELQGRNIELDHEIYDGNDFWIQYFNMALAENYKFKITINGEITEGEIPVISKLYCEMPETLPENQPVTLKWETAENPQTIYIEGFQWSAEEKILDKGQANVSPDSREFIIPAEWLWSNPGTKIRAIQLGITRFVIVNRVAFTFSDGVYKRY